MLLYFMSVWSIFQLFGLFYGHLVYVPPYWYIFNGFGMLQLKKSGNPASGANPTTSEDHMWVK
jgi:hypothetical protein